VAAGGGGVAGVAGVAGAHAEMKKVKISRRERIVTGKYLDNPCINNLLLHKITVL